MEISPLHRAVQASDIPPERLAASTQLTDQQKIGEVARQFEAILLRQILQESQKTVIPSSYADNSTASGIYHDLVSQQLADSISKSGTFGLAGTLERQLTRQLAPVAGRHSGTPATPAPGGTPSLSRKTSPAAHPKAVRTVHHSPIDLTHERTVTESH